MNYIQNTPFKEILVNGIKFIPIPLIHSKNCTGYLIQSQDETIAYLTDCADIDDTSMNFLKSFSIDRCYLDACFALNYDNGNHLNYEEATIILDKINAKKSYFIHCNHYTLEYIRTNKVSLKYKYILPWEEN